MIAGIKMNSDSKLHASVNNKKIRRAGVVLLIVRSKNNNTVK
jgi:hypothetical protein